MEKKIKKTSLNNPKAVQEDLEYWLSRPPEERVSAVEVLRRQHYGDMGRIQKVIRKFRRPTRRINEN
jgi:hypothetical protein